MAPGEYFFGGFIAGVFATIFVGFLWALWGAQKELDANEPQVIDAHFVSRPNTSQSLVRRSTSLTVNKNTKLLGR